MVLRVVVIILASYFLGNLNGAILISRLLAHDDVRRHGSGNAGTTNALRTFGKKAGAITLLGDCLKCVLAIMVVRLIFAGRETEMMPLLCIYAAAGCILGHNFPITLGFRGGKGIAASVGFLIAFDWRMFVICAVVFFALFFTTHYVSLCSLTSYLTALIAMIVIGETGGYGMDRMHTTEMYLVMAALTVLAFWRHRANIVRLSKGTESKVFLSKSKTKKG